MVWAREALCVGLGFGDVASQLINHAIAPFGSSNSLADALTNVPIEINQRGVDGLIRSLPGGSDELDNFLKTGNH